jgi:hypothetical protein
MREMKMMDSLLTWLVFDSRTRRGQTVQAVAAASERSGAGEGRARKARGLLWPPQLLDATGFHFGFQIEISDHETAG